MEMIFDQNAKRKICRRYDLGPANGPPQRQILKSTIPCCSVLTWRLCRWRKPSIKKLIAARFNVITRLNAPEAFSKAFYTNADDKQLAFVAPGEKRIPGGNQRADFAARAGRFDAFKRRKSRPYRQKRGGA